MSFFKKINPKAKASVTTGFGDNAGNYGGRFLNKNGESNTHKTGLGLLERYSWFHSLLKMKRLHFFMVILGFYICANLVFAGLYYLIGVEHLSGMQTHNEKEKFAEAFFFSAQTFTTVGYGRISPTGILTSAIASFEALIGLLTFAVATGLMYGRFSKPTAFIRFSDHALIAPFKSGTALMIRISPFKNTILSDGEAKMTAGIVMEENGKTINKFYPLALEFDKINTMNLSWTLVHPITEDSPMYNLSEEDFKNGSGEIMIFIKAFDDMFSNTVVARSSYTFNEIMYGAKFKPMFYRDETHHRTILDLSKLNAIEKVNIIS